MDLTGAAAIVTGGAGGFGAATVRRLVGAGAKVVIADLAEERAQALSEDLGDAVRFQRTDVTSEESVAAAVAAAAELGPLRVAVVVHGGPTAGARLVNREGKSYGLDVFKRTVDIFLTGTFNVLAQAAEQMATNEPLDSGQRGVVITTASIAGFEGAPGQTDYSAAKGGVIGMNLTAARDLAPLGIRVMCIAPGTFLTNAYPDPVAAEERFGPMVPNPKRIARPDQCTDPRTEPPVTETAILAGDLRARAQRVVGEGVVVGPVAPLTGGASSLTFVTEVAGDRVVLKVAPPGLPPVRNRDVLRQGVLMRALAGHPGVVVPEVVFEDAG